MLIIGSHVGFKSDQLLGSVKEALSYGSNTFMFYTGAPQNTKRSQINEDYLNEALKLMKENNIDPNNLVCHAPYIINPATSILEKQEFAVNFLTQELKRCSLLHVNKIVLHPGSSVNISKEEGLDNIVKCLNEVLKNNIDVDILLETMAGKGNERGVNTSELKYIIDNLDNSDRVGVCLDTCHLNDAGYNLADFDNYLLEFDELIGIHKIGCIHINDSKNEIGSHKDRHECIGEGTIGFDNLINIIYNPKLEGIPKILETPYIGENNDDKKRIYPPYKFEIEMIKEKKKKDNLFDSIRNFYGK